MSDRPRTFNITRVMHYAEDDPKCWGDYYSVTLKDGLGEIIAHFGDSYHDRGREKAEGFIMGLEYGYGRKAVITEEQVADGQE